LRMRKLSINFPKRSTAAWAALGFYIFVYDVVAMSLNDYNKSRDSDKRYETFSDGCWRGVDHPIVRWPIWLLVLILVKHLAAPNFLRKYDPIGLVGSIIRWMRRMNANA